MGGSSLRKRWITGDPKERTSLRPVLARFAKARQYTVDLRTTLLG